MPNYLELHKEKKAERKDLNERRDKDNEMVTSFAYIMKGTGKKKKAITDVINVTMNRLKVFKAYVEAALHKADEKSFVESDNEQVKKDEIKDFIDAGFDSANSLRFSKGQFPLEPYFDDQACMRGEIAALTAFEMMPIKDGKEAHLNTNITPWDTRFITYDPKDEGLAWAGYETTKTKGMIESEPWFEKATIKETGKEALVLNLWTPEDNIIYITEKEVFRQPNPFGYIPISVQKVPIGSMLADKDVLQYQCESIFFLVRDLIEEYYRCVSVLQTLNFLSIKQATQQAMPSGQKDASYEPDDLRPGSNVGVDQVNAISLIPYGKAERSMILALQEINKAINDGTLARITLGDLPGELSAVALIQIEQGQGQVYMPRLGARGLEKEQIARMFIKQSKDLGTTIEMGTEGHKRTWKTSDLEGEYEIGFKYSSKSPETDFARISMAKSYVNVIDEEAILRDVLKRDDPEGDLKKLNRQRLRKFVPSLLIYDGILALAEAHEDGDESAAAELAIAEAQLGVSAKQLLAGNLPQAEQEPRAQPSDIPLITSAGRRTSAQEAADLIRTPTEEEGE